MKHTKPLRKCKCGTTAYTKEELNLFIKEKKGLYGRRSQCYPCAAYAKIGQIARRVYKITHKEYLKRMATSDKCEVCGAVSGDKNWEKLCYDHDHATMKFRGVLCSRCNRAIGQLGDTKESIKKVLNYLER